jgi:hypothetical protein
MEFALQNIILKIIKIFIDVILMSRDYTVEFSVLQCQNITVY